MSDLYTEYAKLDFEIKELTARKDSMKEQILAEIPTKGIDTPVGKFSVTKLKTWIYTPKVVKMSEDLKALKAKEESTLEASFTEKNSLRFVGVKI